MSKGLFPASVSTSFGSLVAEGLTTTLPSTRNRLSQWLRLDERRLQGWNHRNDDGNTCAPHGHRHKLINGAQNMA